MGHEPVDGPGAWDETQFQAYVCGTTLPFRVATTISIACLLP
jgi:hypothetical protein